MGLLQATMQRNFADRWTTTQALPLHASHTPPHQGKRAKAREATSKAKQARTFPREKKSQHPREICEGLSSLRPSHEEIHIFFMNGRGRVKFLVGVSP